MAVVDLSKVMNLADAQEIYKDLRDRINNAGNVKDVTVGGVSVLDENGIAVIVLPTVPVSDVQVDGSSILQNGIANIPTAGSSTFGVIKVSTGLNSSNGVVSVRPAYAADVKGGSSGTKVLFPNTIDAAAFYGLSKVAGVDLANETVTLGTYPDSSKQAIQKMFGLDGILGDFESSAVASKAYAIGETFIYNGKRYRATAAIAISDVIAPGTNCVLDPVDGRYVRFTDKAGTNPGVVRIDPNYGVGHRDAPNDDVLMVNQASLSEMKSGYGQRKPIVPSGQHTAVYYALAKLAGADMASASGETVGTYPEAQKAAIQSMLGVSTGAILIENVSGGTPTLTCLPNVRYKCGEVSTLSITPPASGSCEVIFESGSTATLLTVPNTVKFPPWFDATALETGMIYDIIITDGVYGAVMSWAS